MATAVNPLWQSLTPGFSNPTGSNVSIPSPPNLSGGAQPSNPYMPPVPGLSATNPTSNNPYAVLSPNSPVPASGSPTSTFPAYGSPYGSTAVPGSVSPTSTGAPGSGIVGSGTGSGGTTPGSPSSTYTNSNLLRNLQHTYGQGIGSSLYNFLNSGAGYNSQVLSAMVAQLQPQFTQQQNTLLDQFSAGGERFGSSAQVGESNLMSQQNLEVGSIASNLYEQSINNYMSVLMGSASGAEQRDVAEEQMQTQMIDSLVGSASSVAAAGLM